MDPAAYAEHGAYERWHWWFRGRRAVAGSLLRGLGDGDRGAVLSVGCGYGAELDFLGGFGRPTGTDVERAPLRAAHARGGRTVVAARAEALPFRAGSFALVAMLDVLEHIEPERAALAEARRVLRPGGHVLLMVPALPWLWSAWDVRVHHLRRYTRSGLEASLAGAGFRVRRMTFFNAILLPVVAAVRRFGLLGRALRPADGNEFAIGSGRVLNPVLGLVLGLEARWIRRAGLPLGVTLAALARREP